MPRTAAENERKVHAVVDAMNSRDANSLADLYTENAEIERSILPRPARGKEEIRRHFKTVFEALEDLRAEASNVVATEDNAAAIIRVRYKSKTEIRSDQFEIAPGKGLPAHGRPIEDHLAYFADFDENGKIVRDRIVQDRVGILKQLGITLPAMPAGSGGSGGSTGSAGSGGSSGTGQRGRP